MASITHPDLVRTLAKSGVDILASLTPAKCHLWHMGSCVSSECGELLEAFFIPGTIEKDNICEELGDIFFYTQGIRQEFEPSSYVFEVGDVDSYQELSAVMAIKAGLLFDAIKRHVIYEKQLDPGAVMGYVCAIDALAEKLGMMFGLQKSVILDANIAKLAKRYEGIKYLDQAAHQGCLHLWRCTDGQEFPTPPSWMVGPK